MIWPGVKRRVENWSGGDVLAVCRGRLAGHRSWSTWFIYKRRIWKLGLPAEEDNQTDATIQRKLLGLAGLGPTDTKKQQQSSHFLL